MPNVQPGHGLQPWVCFSSSSGETFRALYTHLAPDARKSLLAFFTDRDCKAHAVAQELLGEGSSAPLENLHRFAKADFENCTLPILQDLARKHQGPICIFLCGYFGILSERFLRECPGAIVNTHPSLLPAFPGLDQKVHKLASESVAISGFTVHLVTEQLDGGPILFQHPVLLDPSLTWESNRSRVRAAEQKFLPGMLTQVLKMNLKPADRNCGSVELRRRLGANFASFSELGELKKEIFQGVGESHGQA